MLDINSINQDSKPRHVAMIMDGNGRWAKKRGLLRTVGHNEALTSVKSAVEVSANLEIPYLTLYAFSTENWNRPKLEVITLMKLFISTIKKQAEDLHKNNIKIQAIGNLEMLPKDVQKSLDEIKEKTKNNTGLTLTLALSYGSKEEIVQAIKNINKKVLAGELSIDDIDETLVDNNLYTKGIPDVDLLIRTSGEVRISNFLLWQIAYSELYFTDTLWPDFNEQEYLKALLHYQNKERRFGKISEQLK